MSSEDSQKLIQSYSSKETAKKHPLHLRSHSSNHDNSQKDNHMIITLAQMISILSKTVRNRTDYDETILQQHFKTHPFFQKLSQQHSLNISQLAIRKLTYLHLTHKEQIPVNTAAVFILSTGSADSQQILESYNTDTSPKHHEDQQQILDDHLKITDLQQEYNRNHLSPQESLSPLEFHCAYLSKNNLDAVMNVKLNEQHQQKMKLLLTSGLFNEFSKTALFNLATSKYLQEQEYHYQQVVYDQGSQVNGIYFIVSGIFTVWKALSSSISSAQVASPKSIRVAELQQVGGAFGYEEICCSEHTRRNQIISNSSESKVLFLPIQFCGRLVQQGKAQAAAQIQSRDAVVQSRQRLEHSHLAIFLCKSKEHLELGEQDVVKEDMKNKNDSEDQGDNGEQLHSQGVSKLLNLQDQLIRLPDISIKSRDLNKQNSNTAKKNSILITGITNCPSGSSRQQQQQQQSQLLQALDRSYQQGIKIHNKVNQSKIVQDEVHLKNNINSSLIISVPDVDSNELKQPKSYSANRRDEFYQIQPSTLFLSQKKQLYNRSQVNTSMDGISNYNNNNNTNCFDNKNNKNLILSLDCILNGDNNSSKNSYNTSCKQNLNGISSRYQKKIMLPNPIKNHLKDKADIIKQNNHQPDNNNNNNVSPQDQKQNKQITNLESNKIKNKPKIISAIYSPNNNQSNNTALSQVLGDEIEQQLTLEREQQLNNFALIISQNSCLQWKGGITEDSVLTRSTLKAVKLNGNKKLAQIPRFNHKRSSTNSVIGNINNNLKELSPLLDLSDSNLKSNHNPSPSEQTDYFYGGPFMKNRQRRQIASLDISSSSSSSSSVLFPLLSPNKISLQGISPSTQSLPSSNNKHHISSSSSSPTQQLLLERHMFSKRNSISKPQPIGGNSNSKSLCSESSMISPASDSHLDSRILSKYNTEITNTSLSSNILPSSQSPSLNRQFLRKTRKRIKEKLLRAHAEKQLEGALQLYQELVLASAETPQTNQKNSGPIMKTVSLRINCEYENLDSKNE